MKYIYDILLNFNETRIYDFYEWSPDDDIEYFKKIPLIRVNEETYKSLTIGCTTEDRIFLESIYNTTEIYHNKTVRRLDYASIVTNGKEAAALLLNKSGKVIMMSRMLLDEEEEAVEVGNTLNEKIIPIISSNQPDTKDLSYLTRCESRKMFFLNKELYDLYTNKNIVKLKYLYYECSNQIEDDIDIIYDKIKLFLIDEWNSKHDELYNLVRLSYSKK